MIMILIKKAYNCLQYDIFMTSKSNAPWLGGDSFRETNVFFAKREMKIWFWWKLFLVEFQDKEVTMCS